MAKRHRQRRPRTRRSPGDGSVYFDRRSGRWIAQIDVSGPSGPRRYKRTKHPTESAARAALRSLFADVEAVRSGDGPRLDAWIATWLQSRDVRELAASTRQWYAQMAAAHITAAGIGIGHYPLRAISPATIDDWIDRLKARKRTANTVVVARNILRIALAHAVRKGLLETNPAQVVRLRHGRQRRIRALTLDETRRLLDASPPWLRTALAIMVTSGLRRGELLGLQWDDVDWSAATIHVQRAVVAVADRVDSTPGPGVKPPKTEAGNRRVPLLPLAAELLAGHRRLVEHQAVARSRSVPTWIFAAETGNFLSPRNLNRAYYAARARAGLPSSIRLHDLRHTAATALLSLGTDDAVVAAWIGHTDVRTTRSIYHHPDVDAAAEGAQALNRYWRRALSVSQE